MPRATGGLGDMKEPDDRIKEVVARVESEIRSKLVDNLGEVSGPIEPVGYKTQVVAGTNFFVKLLVGKGEPPKIVHARIYRNLQGDVSLHSVTEEKSHEDDVEYF